MTETAGHVHGAAPWTKALVASFASRFPESYRAIEDAIPAGHWLVIVAAHGSYGQWVAILRNETGEVVRSDARSTVTAACYAALEAGREAAA